MNRDEIATRRDPVLSWVLTRTHPWLLLENQKLYGRNALHKHFLPYDFAYKFAVAQKQKYISLVYIYSLPRSPISAFILIRDRKVVEKEKNEDNRIQERKRRD